MSKPPKNAERLFKTIRRGRYIVPKERSHPNCFRLTAAQLIDAMGGRHDQGWVAETVYQGFAVGWLQDRDGIIVYP